MWNNIKIAFFAIAIIALCIGAIALFYAVSVIMSIVCLIGLVFFLVKCFT